MSYEDHIPWHRKYWDTDLDDIDIMFKRWKDYLYMVKVLEFINFHKNYFLYNKLKDSN